MKMTSTNIIQMSEYTNKICNEALILEFGNDIDHSVINAFVYSTLLEDMKHLHKYSYIRGLLQEEVNKTEEIIGGISNDNSN